MAKQDLLIGHFKFIDDVENAVTWLRDRGFDDLDVYSPFPNHSLEHLLKGKKRSPIRFFTLLGGISGCLGGYLMTSWMSIDWPLRTSAKPIVSIPAYTVIAFECTILLGAIFTLLSMFHFCRIPHVFFTPEYRGTFSEDVFGLVVRLDKGVLRECEDKFRALGAEEVEVQYARS